MMQGHLYKIINDWSVQMTRAKYGRHSPMGDQGLDANSKEWQG
jgi:hypothetical protein